MSLDEAVRLRADTGREIVVFTHFPPSWAGVDADSIMDLLTEYGIKRAYFGHIHGAQAPDITSVRGVELHLISADHLGFMPKIVK